MNSLGWKRCVPISAGDSNARGLCCASVLTGTLKRRNLFFDLFRSCFAAYRCLLITLQHPLLSKVRSIPFFDLDCTHVLAIMLQATFREHGLVAEICQVFLVGRVGMCFTRCIVQVLRKTSEPVRRQLARSAAVFSCLLHVCRLDV